jgi:hypothetical protein
MRTAIHPERAPLLEVADVEMYGHDLLRLGIALVPDPHVERTAKDIRGGVSAALMLGHRQPGGVPGLGERAGVLVDRQPEIVAERGPGNSLRLVLVEEGAVAAGEVGLRRCRWRECEQHHGAGAEEDLQATHGWRPPGAAGERLR